MMRSGDIAGAIILALVIAGVLAFGAGLLVGWLI